MSDTEPDADVRTGRASRKVPDGKLVEVRVRYDDRLRDVEIRGDFFLEPPAALGDLEAAVTGVPADASVETVADAVRGVEAELIGFDAVDVGAAVRAAVDGA